MVTSRSASQPFTLEDWWAHQPKVRAENAGRANCATVDVASVTAGMPVDSPEFEAAMADVGFGATVVCGPPPEEPDEGDENRSYRAGFELESFHCLRAVGDQWGSRDEIFWSVGARSDNDNGTVYTSPEFGKMEEGKTQPFPPGATIFSGPTSNAVVVNVLVWEVDGSPGAWYSAVKNAMRAWLDKPLWMDLLGIAMGFVPLPGNTLAVDIAIELAQLFVDIIGMIRNENDLSCERIIVFDRNALMSLYHRKNDTWTFNGDGWHSLRVKYIGDRPLFPAGAIDYVTVDSPTSAVSTPISLGWRSAAPPALCSAGGKLHCLYIRPRDHAVMWAVNSDGLWTRPVRVQSFPNSQYRPAMAVNVLGQLHAAIVDMNGQIVISTYSSRDDTWSETTPARNRLTDRAPALTTFPAFIYGPKLTLLNRQQNGSLGKSRRLDGVWMPEDGPASVNYWKTAHAPSIARFKDHLWLAWASEGGYLHIAYIENSLYANYHTVDAPHSVSFADGPALATHDDTLWLAVRGSAGKLHLHPRNQDGWDATNHKIVDVEAMLGEPTLASHAGQLYLAYRRP